MGTLIAWVLVRDPFPGKRLLEVVIDIPFALPTIVAGLVLLSLYGPNSPLGVNVANTRTLGVPRAAVRHAALRRPHRPARPDGARPRRRGGRRVARGEPVHDVAPHHPPGLAPAITAGAALSFARGISEYGSLVLLSGNLPIKTEVASVRILTYIENGNEAAAASVATILLARRPVRDRRCCRSCPSGWHAVASHAQPRTAGTYVRG